MILQTGLQQLGPLWIWGINVDRELIDDVAWKTGCARIYKFNGKIMVHLIKFISDKEADHTIRTFENLETAITFIGEIRNGIDTRKI